MKPDEIQVIMRSDKDHYLAYGIFTGKELTVLKGSKVFLSEQDMLYRRRLKTRGLDENGILLQDMLFRSPNAASIFVCGKQSDGWKEWVTPEGFPLETFRNTATDNPAKGGSRKPISVSADPTKPCVPTQLHVLSTAKKPEEPKEAQTPQIQTEASIGREPQYKPSVSHSVDSFTVSALQKDSVKTWKMLLCSDICLGAISTEKLDIKQSQKWQTARNAKFEDLIDNAVQNNATYVALFGRLFGQERVTESVIDTLFQSVKEDAGITVLVFLNASEYKRISYRNDVPENLHLINMEKQDSFLDDRLALRINAGAAELQLGDNELIVIQKDGAGKYVLTGIPDAVIPSFEPTDFEDAQGNQFGFGILEWTANQIGRYQVKGGSKYAYHAIELKIMPEDDQKEILRKINNLVKRIDIDTFLRVTVTGRSAFGLTLNSDALKNQLQGRIFFVEVYDNTVMDIDEESFENDISLRSEFVKLALQDGTLSESERNHLISLGWNALSGKEVSAE